MSVVLITETLKIQLTYENTGLTSAVWLMTSKALSPLDVWTVVQNVNCRASFVTLFSTVIITRIAPPSVGVEAVAVSLLVSVI